MRPFLWLPTESERQAIVENIMAPIIDRDGTADLLAQLPDAPIAFFSDLLVSIQAIAAGPEIPKHAADLKTLVRNAERVRQQLDTRIRKHRPPLGDVLQHALTLWHEQAVATRSYIND